MPIYVDPETGKSVGSPFRRKPLPVPEIVSEKEKQKVPIELTPETFKWLYNFVQDAIDGGLSLDDSVITEEVCRELSRHDLIERARGNDGDYAWHGKVKLSDSFVKEIVKGINLYGIIRGIVYERSLDSERK